jgi:surfactin synthase thioesterase subunit
MRRFRRSITSNRLDEGSIGLLELGRGAAGSPELYCFPYAGGGPLAFRQLAELLPMSWNVKAMDPPGHVRTQGRAHRSVEAMADHYLKALPPESFEGAYLLGHSLGGYVALELASLLESHGVSPAGVIISATTPPAARNRQRPLAELPDDELIAWMTSIGQAPGSREIFDVFKDVIRADLVAFESYEPSPFPIETPVLVIAAHDDPMCPAERFFEWRAHAIDTHVSFVSGGHFFVQSQPVEMADPIRRFVDRTRAPRLDVHHAHRLAG